VTEIPPCEQANFIENRQDKALAYVLQMGIPEWNPATEYQPESYTTYNQVLYKSKGVNTNKQPNTNPLNWGIAFDVYGSADAVQQELDALLLDADPFDQYALKASPVFTGKAVGTSYAAGTGLPTDNLSDVGHSFVADGDSGMFKDGSDLVFAVDAVERGRVKSGVLSPTDSSTALATTEWVKQLIGETLFPVGAIHITTASITPLEQFGFGVWQRFGQGRAIVGYSDDVTSATPDWYKAIGSTFGEENVTLSNDQIPPHKHRLPITNTSNSVVLNEFTDITPSPTTYFHIPQDTVITDNGWGLRKENFGAAGGGLPHNNVQPSIVVAIWKRIA
jgi:hypothetical protein